MRILYLMWSILTNAGTTYLVLPPQSGSYGLAFVAVFLFFIFASGFIGYFTVAFMKEQNMKSWQRVVPVISTGMMVVALFAYGPF